MTEALLKILLTIKKENTYSIIQTYKGHDTVVSLSAGDETRPAEALLLG